MLSADCALACLRLCLSGSLAADFTAILTHILMRWPGAISEAEQRAIQVSAGGVFGATGGQEVESLATTISCIYIYIREVFSKN